MLELQKHIRKFCNDLDFEIRGDYIQFNYNEGLINFLKENEIQYDPIRTEEIHIKYQDIGFNIFKNTIILIHSKTTTCSKCTTSSNKKINISVNPYGEAPLKTK